MVCFMDVSLLLLMVFGNLICVCLFVRVFMVFCSCFSGWVMDCLISYVMVGSKINSLVIVLLMVMVVIEWVDVSCVVDFCCICVVVVLRVLICGGISVKRVFSR